MNRLRVIVEADGGSRGNPGPAGYGAVVRDESSGAVLAERMDYLGIQTNNVAEYHGLIAGLTAAAEVGAHLVTVRMDSKLVIEQMTGRWQIKHPAMRQLAEQAAALASRFDDVSYGWIPRAQNSAADRLANLAMDAGRSSTPAAEPAPVSAAGPINNNSSWLATDRRPSRFILLRHGVTEYSLAKRFAGRSDLPLTAEGHDQARRAANRVRQLGPVDALYSSPLLRTRQTAEAVAAALQLPVRVDDDLIETDYGDWDGYTFDEVRLRWPDQLARWLEDPAVAPQAGESLRSTARRVARARSRILAAHPEETVVLVTHVSPIKALVQLAMQAPEAAVHRMYLAPASISVIDYFADEFPGETASAAAARVSLRSYNETGHLTG
jgi:broad specificity phosphatase PhoE/ribonuclease HI